MASWPISYGPALSEVHFTASATTRITVSPWFDYFGSWSEAARQHLVSLEDAVLCTQRFALAGTADTDRVLFEPD
jgi:hypothetical protein